MTGVMSKENRFESRDFFGGENWEECDFFCCVGLAVDERSADKFYAIPWGVPSKIIMEEEI